MVITLTQCDNIIAHLQCMLFTVRACVTCVIDITIINSKGAIIVELRID